MESKTKESRSTLNQHLYVSVYSSFKFKYIFNIILTYIVNVESTLNQQTRARWVMFILTIWQGWDKYCPAGKFAGMANIPKNMKMANTGISE